MDMFLTGRMMDAAERNARALSRVSSRCAADRRGLEGRRGIAAMSSPAACREGERQPRLRDVACRGVRFERRIFHALFGTEDQKEGMPAFLEKRAAAFKNR